MDSTLKLKYPLRVWILGPVGEESYASSLSIANVAANRWLTFLSRALIEAGVSVTVLSQLAASPWPKGSWRCRSRPELLAEAFPVRDAPYNNLPIFRSLGKKVGWLRALRQELQQEPPPDVLLAYNTSDDLDAVRRWWQQHQPSPFIWMIADVMLNPRYQKKHEMMLAAGDAALFFACAPFEQSSLAKKIHLEGGVVDRGTVPAVTPSPVTRLLFVGSADEGCHTGIDSLLDAMGLLAAEPVQLTVLGGGKNPRLMRGVQRGNVSWEGFVPEQRILELLPQTDFFINPRRTDFPPNQGNFPSKLLDYLAWERPIISTWTAGMPPEYRQHLIVAESSAPSDLAAAIRRASKLNSSEREEQAQAARRWVLQAKSWNTQATRLTQWIQQKLNCKTSGSL